MNEKELLQKFRDILLDIQFSIMERRDVCYDDRFALIEMVSEKGYKVLDDLEVIVR